MRKTVNQAAKTKLVLLQDEDDPGLYHKGGELVRYNQDDIDRLDATYDVTIIQIVRDSTPLPDDKQAVSD